MFAHICVWYQLWITCCSICHCANHHPWLQEGNADKEISVCARVSLHIKTSVCVCADLHVHESVCISQPTKYTLKQSRSQTQCWLSGTRDKQPLMTTHTHTRTHTHTLWVHLKTENRRQRLLSEEFPPSRVSAWTFSRSMEIECILVSNTLDMCVHWSVRMCWAAWLHAFEGIHLVFLCGLCVCVGQRVGEMQIQNLWIIEALSDASARSKNPACPSPFDSYMTAHTQTDSSS